MGRWVSDKEYWDDGEANTEGTLEDTKQQVRGSGPVVSGGGQGSCQGRHCGQLSCISCGDAVGGDPGSDCCEGSEGTGLEEAQVTFDHWEDAVQFLDNLDHANGLGLKVEYTAFVIKALKRGDTMAEAIWYAFCEWDL